MTKDKTMIKGGGKDYSTHRFDSSTYIVVKTSVRREANTGKLFTVQKTISKPSKPSK